jgi:hypothetical protein
VTASAAETHRLAAAMLHDVGKYVARTARNLRDGQPIEGPLAEMLLRDVFETWRGRRASERFEALATELARAMPDPRIDAVRADLAAIDAAEDAARRGEPAALRTIAERARAVEDALRGVARAAMARAKGEIE